jgi:hypothetical protein
LPSQHREIPLFSRDSDVAKKRRSYTGSDFVAQSHRLYQWREEDYLGFRSLFASFAVPEEYPRRPLGSKNISIVFTDEGLVLIRRSQRKQQAPKQKAAALEYKGMRYEPDLSKVN